jgi:hypothetical protein
MTPRFQRYYLVLLLLTAGGATVASTGCSRGSGSAGGFASTAASTTSSSHTTPGAVTTGVVTKTPPQITAAVWETNATRGRAALGDKVRVTFDREISFKSPKLDATKEFSLAISGDSLGVGATVEADPTNLKGAIITLGDKANLKIGGAFVTTQTTPGSPSGINVSQLATGQIVCAKDSCPITPAKSPLDIDGNAKASFTDGPSMVTARGAHEAVALDDGRVLVVGGMRDGKKEDFAQDSEIFDPVTGNFTSVSSLSGTTKGRMMNGSVIVERIRHTATKLKDGTVLITGGYGIDRKGFFGLGGLKKEVIADAHIFDPATNTFTRIGELNHARHSHSATLLLDGRVLISGGYSDSFWSRQKTLAPFELYDPKTKTFTEEKHWLFFTQGTIEKRMNHAAILTDAGVLLAGGEYWDGGFLHFFGKNTLKIDKGSEVFDPKNNSFKKSGDLSRARRYAAAAVISTHEVLLAGGNDSTGPVEQLELWSPATGKWTNGDKLAHPRTNAKVAKDGERIFVIGGFAMAANGEVKQVEVFDGVAKKMTAGYDLKTGRNGCAVTELKDGRILVSGGFTGVTKDVIGLDGQPLASTEIFSAP